MSFSWIPEQFAGLRGSNDGFWGSGVLWDPLKGSLGVADRASTCTSPLLLGI